MMHHDTAWDRYLISHTCSVHQVSEMRLLYHRMDPQIHVVRPMSVLRCARGNYSLQYYSTMASLPINPTQRTAAQDSLPLLLLQKS
jgi:hypothetical protein